MVEEAPPEPISDEVHERLLNRVLRPCKIELPEAAVRRATERLAAIFSYTVSMCAYRWSVSNTSKPREAHRPRNTGMCQLFGSLSTFWIDFVGWSGVSFNGEHYGGPFARFAGRMCVEILENLSKEPKTQGAPMIKSLELVCANPTKVRMWLRQIGITQLGSNFERFLRGGLFIAKELPGWQFEMDEPRESCYQIKAVDPKGRSRFIEQGLNLKAVRKAAVSRALRLARRKQTKAPKARSRTKK